MHILTLVQGISKKN